MVRAVDEVWRELVLWIRLEARYQLARAAGGYPPRDETFMRYRAAGGYELAGAQVKRNKMGGREMRLFVKARVVEVINHVVPGETMSRAHFMQDFVYPQR